MRNGSNGRGGESCKRCVRGGKVEPMAIKYNTIATTSEIPDESDSSYFRRFKTCGGCLPLAPFFKMYTRQCRATLKTREFADDFKVRLV